MHYVYAIKSVVDGRYYFGSTNDLGRRMLEHNAGKSPHTSKYGPWELAWYGAFTSIQKAEDFEKYLKEGSGYAFSRKRLL